MPTYPVSLKDNGDGMAISTHCLNWKGNCCWIATSPFSLKGYSDDGWPPLPYKVEGDWNSHLYIRSKKRLRWCWGGILYIQSKVGRGMECKPVQRL